MSFYNSTLIALREYFPNELTTYRACIPKAITSTSRMSQNNFSGLLNQFFKMTSLY